MAQWFEIGSLDVVAVELVVGVVLKYVFLTFICEKNLTNLLSEIEYDFVGEVQLALHVLAELSEAERRFGVGRQCMFGSPDLVMLD